MAAPTSSNKSQQRIWLDYLSTSFLRYPPHLHKRIGPEPPPASPTDHHFPTPDPPNSYATLPDYISALPRTHRRLLSNYTQLCTDLQLWRSLRSKRRLEVVSDGGLQETNGTFGWKIVGKQGLVIFQGSGPVDGPFELANSTRSEIGGFAAPLLLVTIISKYWGLRHRCKFHWIVDSTAAISKVSITLRKNGKTPCRQPSEFDLLSFIDQLTRELRRPIQITWIKGHQDDKTEYDKLPRLAKLNVDADKLATDHRISHSTQSSPIINHLPSSRVSISINGRRLTSKIDEAIRFHVDGYPMRIYLQHKHSWSDKVWDSIDFYLFGRHFKKLKPSAQTAHMKVVHDQQPLGKRRLQQSSIQDPVLQLCPCCKTAPETQFHLLQCTANPERTEIMSTFKKAATDSKLHPVKYILSAGIYSWLTDPSVPYNPTLTDFPSHHHDELSAALAEQEHIGWDKAVLGFLSKKWQSSASVDMFDRTQADYAEGNHMILKVLSALYDMTRSIWLSRNAKLHDRKDELARTIQSSDDAEIRHYHSNPHLLPLDDQHYCERPIANLLRSPLSVRRRWLKHIRSARANKLRDNLLQTNLRHFYTAAKTPRLPPHETRSPSPPLAG